MISNTSLLNETTTVDLIWNRSSTIGNSIATSGSHVGFRVVIIIIGVVGVFANGLVLLLLKRSASSKKERVNLLMMNQMMLDMYSCAMLTAVYAAKIVNVYLTSSWGFWLCVMFVGETPLWIGLNGSITNLVIIAVERYVMVVHPIWHKNHVRAWMIHSAIAFTWIYGTVTNVPLYIETSRIVDGQCIWIAFWSSKASAITYAIWYFIFSYVVPIITFCFCYASNTVGNSTPVTSAAACGTSIQWSAGNDCSDQCTSY